MEEQMTSATYSDTKSASSGNLAILGAIAGLGGGLVFGLLMGMMGMLPMVGMLIGVESAVVGFIVHMVISMIIGAIFGLTVGRFSTSWGPVILAGIVYGAIWWVLGALFLMPLLLGMNEMIFAIGQPQWMSLMGHVLYGTITAVLFVLLVKRI
jgi:uncharacterized membrane protein YagU involved in acid resistance